MRSSHAGVRLHRGRDQLGEVAEVLPDEERRPADDPAFGASTWRTLRRDAAVVPTSPAEIRRLTEFGEPRSMVAQ